jgi:16S rRNA (guanine527-N7)-methyltransferase
MSERGKGSQPASPGPQEREALLRGLRSLDLAVGAEAVEKLLAYAGLVRKWSRSYNLVASGDLGLLIGRHLLDSLSIQPHIGAGPLLDAGSGAGFPGLPLAIVNPGLEATLLDSAGKKVRFLRHVIRNLGLGNVEAVHSRIEAFPREAPYRAIVSRAFCSLADFAARARHLAGPQTRLLAMKGRRPASELGELPDWVSVQAVERIEVPDLHAERHLVIMCVSPESA